MPARFRSSGFPSIPVYLKVSDGEDFTCNVGYLFNTSIDTPMPGYKTPDATVADMYRDLFQASAEQRGTDLDAALTQFLDTMERQLEGVYGMNAQAIQSRKLLAFPRLGDFSMTIFGMGTATGFIYTVAKTVPDVLGINIIEPTNGALATACLVYAAHLASSLRKQVRIRKVFRFADAVIIWVTLSVLTPFIKLAIATLTFGEVYGDIRVDTPLQILQATAVLGTGRVGQYGTGFMDQTQFNHYLAAAAA